MTMTKAEVAETASGIAYLVFTLVLSLYYLRILSPAVSNDLWWSGFNASGAQSYIIDVFNNELNFAGTGSIDFTSNSIGLAKDYSTFYTPLEVATAYPLNVLKGGTRDLPNIITALRDVDGPNAALPTQYCWVDFNKTWEVAHTKLRQARCYANYGANAAVYYETTLRLVDWKRYMSTNEFVFNVSLGNAIRKSAEGVNWIRLTKNGFVDVATEVAYWKHMGITNFELQYTNLYAWGVDEKINIHSAFGGTQSISLKNTAYKHRGALWTTAPMCWGPWNDMSIWASEGLSLVRSDPANQQFTPPCSYANYTADPAAYACEPCKPEWNPNPSSCQPDFEKYYKFPPLPGVKMASANIGPLGSIDLYLVAVPPSLTSLVTAFQASITVLAQSNQAFNNAMAAIPSNYADPVPTAWTSTPFMFLGGSPNCVLRHPLPFVQPSFAFDAICAKQERHTMLFNKLNMLFALFASSPSTVDASAICSMCPTMASMCSPVVTSAATALAIFHNENPARDEFARLITAARADIVSLGLGTMQYAINTNTNTNQVLFQPLLSTPPAAWDVVGWASLFEWATGVREVVRFKGDVTTLALMSNKYSPMISRASALEVTKSGCQYIWVGSVVVSAVLVSVGMIVTFYTLLVRFRIVGRNLFYFNRVVGAVWLGRPLLLVRGMTAVVLLSTSPLDFGVFHGFTRFDFAPRTFLESMIVSGEAMWISYVINDLLLLVDRNAQRYFAPISTFVGWVICVVYDVASPYRITANLDRQCKVNYKNKKLTCVSGRIDLGSAPRAITLVMIQLACVFGAFVGVKLWQYIRRPSKTNPVKNDHLLLPGTATAFLYKETVSGGTWVIDRASCAMCGLITFGAYFFDLKLWLLVVDPEASKPAKWGKRSFKQPELNQADRCHSTGTKCAYEPTGGGPPPPRKAQHWSRLSALAGLFYVFATIFGSVTYLSLTAQNMANDLWWANYNSSREHAYVARWYNQQLVLRPTAGQVTLDDDSKFVDEADYNISLPTAVLVPMAPLYVTAVKSTDGSDVAMVVRGLRSMDACLAPWISTQYCWVDFERTWEMANSAKRQLRCNQEYKANAANYLESMLRNVNWDQLESCWGTSLTTALATPLSQTDKGTKWWATVKATRVSEADEVSYWTSSGVTAYKVDWQNYKTVGIIDTFNIQNAFGLSYPMTLKYTNGTFRLTSQTSMKMYWSFASDLWAVTSLTSKMGGASLIRDTPNYAFTTVTMEDVLVTNGTLLASQLATDTYSVFRQVIGPFGSVDIKHVPAPPSLTALVTRLRDEIGHMRAKSMTFSQEFAQLSVKMQANYAPASWLNAGFSHSVGGNLLCTSVPPTKISTSGIYLFTGAESACSVGLGETIASPSTYGRLLGAVAANIVKPDLTLAETDAICSQMKSEAAKCRVSFVAKPVAFLLNSTLFPDRAVLATWRAMIATVQKEIRVMDVNIVQYGAKALPPVNYTLLRQNIFDPDLPAFHYLGWILAYEWAIAAREVLSFQGDIGSVNVITTIIQDVGSLVNPLEIPFNVAYYIRYACLYVTCIFICVAALVMIYLLGNRGYVEGLNLFELNRVAGVVCIGRTFLFIRSMAAISLLSTQDLALEPINLLYHFVSTNAVVNETATDQAIRYFKIVLATSEVSWLVFVLNDVLMVFTQQYTTAYVYKCNFMVWGLSAILSFAAPMTHTATLERTCEYSQVDYQLVCTNGTVAIGSVTRFLTLVGICVGSVVVCYVYERLRNPHLPPPNQSSLFLASSAKFVFDPRSWVAHEVYYIDPASAVINGILSVRAKNTFYIFDLKIWRVFVVEETAERRGRLERDGNDHLLSAIPLTD